MSMNLNQLNCLIAVAKYLNFTEAARELNLVQSAVSHNISELEKELGVELFIRKYRSIALTPAGEILLKEAYKITDAVRDAEAKTRSAANGDTGCLSFGYVFTPLAADYIPRIQAFAQAYPSIEVSYNSYDSVTIPRLLENYKLDFGFARYRTVAAKEKLKWHFLYNCELCAVVSEHHYLAGAESVKFERLLNENLLLINRQITPGMHDMAIEICMDAGGLPVIRDEYNDILTVVMLVELGAGFTILPESWRNTFNSRLSFIPIEGTPRHEVGLAWNGNIKNHAAATFLRYMGID